MKSEYLGADYLAFGSFFETNTKKDTTKINIFNAIMEAILLIFSSRRFLCFLYDISLILLINLVIFLLSRGANFFL